MAKQVLLQTAAEGSYYDLTFDRLEQLWNLSNEYVENGRLQSREEEWFPLLEQHMYLSLLTCHDSAAKLALQRIIDRFGVEGHRVAKLRMAFVRATQEPDQFNKLVDELKDTDWDARKIALVNLKARGKVQLYIEALIAYLAESPVDGEAWSELAESYVTTGNYEDAIQALDQVLIITPFAYNIFARYGEIRQLQATLMQGGMKGALAQMEDAVHHLARATELCPSYTRAWCGLYVTAIKTSQLGAGEDYQLLAKKARTVLEKLVQANYGDPADTEAAKKILAAHAL